MKLINEIFDNPIAYRQSRSRDSNIIRYKFGNVVDGDRKEYAVEFRYSSPVKDYKVVGNPKPLVNLINIHGGYDVTFVYIDNSGERHSAGLTGFKNSQKVITTVIAIVMDFLDDNDVLLAFTAVMDKKLNLYKMIVQKLAMKYPIEYQTQRDVIVMARSDSKYFTGDDNEVE